MSDTLLFERIDELVEDCNGAVGNWEDVLRRARIESQPPRLHFWLPSRRLLLAAAILISLIVILFVTPAFGLLKNWIGRKNVPFTGKTAPYEVKKEFSDLSIGAPKGMAPQAIDSQARRVTTFRLAGVDRVLYVAPTRSGGFCWTFTHSVADGCVQSRNERSYSVPGTVNPQLLAFTDGMERIPGSRHRFQVFIGAAILAKNAASLTLEYQNHHSVRLPFVWVSKPIDAGFFIYVRPPHHRLPGTRPDALILRDSKGKLVAKTWIEPWLHMPARSTTTASPPQTKPKPLSPKKPTAPLQRAKKEGVVVVAGKNGVASIDTSHATPRVRRLIENGADWSCFSFMPFHEIDPVGMGESLTANGTHELLPVGGIRTPFDGCDITGRWGRKWPDRLHSHAIVEIAFTARGRKYFADHAAAGDLALFVRLLRPSGIRRLSGDALRNAISTKFGDAITHLRSISGPLSPDHLGYVDLPGGAVYLERSTTGRLFHIRVENGEIVEENVRPLVLLH